MPRRGSGYLKKGKIDSIIRRGWDIREIYIAGTPCRFI